MTTILYALGAALGFVCDHSWSWPLREIQTCTLCGAQRSNRMLEVRAQWERDGRGNSGRPCEVK